MTNLIQSIEATARRGAEGLAPDARGELVSALLALQRPDGGFAGLDGRSDPYYSFFAWLGLRALGAEYDRDRLCAYMTANRRSARRIEARCAEVVLLREGRRSRAAGWRAVVGSLLRGEAGDAYGAFMLGLLADTLLASGMPRWAVRAAWRTLATREWGRLPTPQLAAARVIAGIAREEASSLLAALERRRCACGGFAAAAGAPPDLLATAVARFVIGSRQSATDTRDAAAKVLMRKGELDMDLAFVEACWLENGLFGPSPSALRGDVEHTFYGLLALGSCR
jgi:hypothetical protein